MSGIALRTTTTGALRRLIEGWRRLLLGIGDGIAAARRYERLAALSDAELARAGLTRTDLPWLAFSGQRPTPPAPPDILTTSASRPAGAAAVRAPSRSPDAD